MKYLNTLIFAITACACSFASAQATLGVSAAIVSRVITYDGAAGTTQVWIWLNSNSRVGPNPANASVTCELWTFNRNIHATALTAMLSGKKVDVQYADNSSGSFWCKVQSISLLNE